MRSSFATLFGVAALLALLATAPLAGAAKHNAGLRALPAPTAASTIPGAAVDVEIRGATLYLVAGNQLRIVDVHDPAAPQLLSSYQLHCPSDCTQTSISTLAATALEVVGDRAFITTAYVPTSCCLVGTVEIVDVQDSAHPQQVGLLRTGGSNDIRVVEQHAYLANRYRVSDVPAFTIVPITDPAHPVASGSYAGNRRGALSMDVAGTLAFVPQALGIDIVDVSNPISPTLRATFGSSTISAIQVVGNLAYAAGTDGLLVFDISNPDTVTLRSSYATAGTPVSLTVVDQRAYLAEGTAGVEVIDVSDPSLPLLRARYGMLGNARRVAVNGENIYVAAGDAGVQLLQLASETQATATIPTAGGILTSTTDGTSYQFATGTFSSTATVTHTVLAGYGLVGTPTLIGGHVFDVRAADSLGRLVAPTKPFTITVQYTDADRGPALVDTLALYRWNGMRWVWEPGSTVDVVQRTVTAIVFACGRFALLGEGRRVFLPLAQQ